MHGLNGDISFFSFGTWVWHPVLLALNFGCWISQHCGLSVLFCRTVSVKLSFLDLEMIGLVSSIFGQHLSFYSVHLICNILGDLGLVYEILKV
ncbi:hypothetical protein GLOIN_2v1886488 [Rhizophagus irregularis DAOM 181602=DAOM 197198]|nr:hypothetical protein GLOIN_2v1886488 [Rhizophagus irregularis DAOM 181602=DAOM 197198]